MNETLSKFITNLRKFLEDLNRYVPNKGTSDILREYEKLSMSKVITKLYKTLRPLEGSLKNRDESIFSHELKLLPGLDLSQLWGQLTEKRQKKVWAYLNLLLVLADMLVKEANPQKGNNWKVGAMSKMEEQVNAPTETQSESSEKKVGDGKTGELDTAEKPGLGFNPYVGIGESQAENFGTDQLYAGPEKLPGEEEQSGGIPGLGMLAGAAGLGNVSLDDLQNELKNMSDADLNDATAGLKDMLGSSTDDRTADLFGSMIESITTELKSHDIANGDPLENMMAVAQNVAQKLQGKMSHDDMEHLVESTKNMAQKHADEMGIGGNLDDPNKLMSDLMNKMEQQK